ncbi:LPS assembly lipoprotein LptE [Chitinibacter tainanensis]|uniref:LPS-assembly lipoprotein LptE n=1 Tax=Chitinibacter tainanensis TaxID=230667 RepID=UPI002357EDCE|nr:LPS assembly lipoprotein LptE [Chitinibacter tainanensis]
MTLTLRTLLLTLLSTLLVACGFHLRGQGPAAKLSFTTAQVVGEGAASQELTRQFQLMQITVTRNQPELSVQILNESADRQVLSVNNSGQVSEYRLFYRVRFSANQKGEPLLDDVPLTLQRNISWDENSVLSKESEEARLYKEMQRDAAAQIVRRIAAAAKAQQAKAASTASAAGQ